MDVRGATVIVTGASSGIGAALARNLAVRGATVVAMARRRDRLEQVVADCRAHTPDSRLSVLDLHDPDAAERAVLAAWDDLGGIDVLVNNAAIPKRRHATRLTQHEVEETMQVNFLSPARMTLALLPRMLERGRGVIVNVSSLGGRLGIVDEAAYCASKFALCGWTECLFLDLFDSPIDVRLIVPGPIDTEIWDQPGNDDPIYDGEKVPPEEVAEGIVAAIEGDRFEHYLPDLKPVADMKQADVQGFLQSMAEQFRSD